MGLKMAPPNFVQLVEPEGVLCVPCRRIGPQIGHQSDRPFYHHGA